MRRVPSPTETNTLLLSRWNQVLITTHTDNVCWVVAVGAQIYSVVDMQLLRTSILSTRCRILDIWLMPTRRETSLFLRVVRSTACSAYLYRDVEPIAGHLACHHKCQGMLLLDGPSASPNSHIVRKSVCASVRLPGMVASRSRSIWSLFSPCCPFLHYFIFFFFFRFCFSCLFISFSCPHLGHRSVFLPIAFHKEFLTVTWLRRPCINLHRHRASTHIGPSMLW